MSVHASEVRATTALDGVLRRAGAVFASRNGHSVPVNYGSAAGELAACVSGVGLADCSHLIKLEIDGSPETLAALAVHLTGSSPVPGGAVPAGGVWWCGEPAAGHSGAEPEADLGRLIVLGEPPAAQRLHDRLRGMAAQWPALRLHDRSTEWGAIAVVGLRAGQLLAALEVYGPSGDPRDSSPFTRRPLGGVPARWLLQSDRRTVALMDRHQADVVWRALEHAGAALGVCCVGTDALARHALLERRRELRLLR